VSDGGVRVLIVDDEECIRETLAEFLREAGHDVAIATDAAAARTALAATPFDVVVTDVVMPRESGVELLRFVRERQPDAKVILITGEPSFETAAEAVRAGGFDYLSKPVTQATVTRAVAAAARVVVLERENRAWQERLEALVAERTAALRESEARYRLLTEQQRDVVVSIAPDGTLAYCSPAVRAFGGYDPDDERGAPVEKYVHPEDWPGVALQMATMLTEQVSATTEFRYVARDGSSFPVEVTGAPLVDHGTVRSIQCILRDVSERKRAEAAQRERLSRMERQREALAALAGDPAFTSGDFEATTAQVAERAAAAVDAERVSVWLQAPEDGRLRPVAVWDARVGALVAGRELPRAGLARLLGLLAGERALAVSDIPGDPRLTPDLAGYGAELSLGAALVAPLRVRGEIRGAVSFAVHDRPREWHADERAFAAAVGDHLAQALLIAERVQAEQDRADLRDQLAQAQRLEAIGRLAGGVAHDFNNILTGISGYTAMVLEALAPQDPLREDVEEIRVAAERASWLTRQLLAFSRRQVLAPRVLQLDDVVERARRMLARLVGEDIRLESGTSAGLWSIQADPGQLDQVLVNLAVNARDALPRGGTFALETANVLVPEGERRASPDARPGEFVRLRARDDGVGMDAALLPHIFEPFFTTKEVGKGTGLGLATVYGIVRQCGGFVEVTSCPGEGATFDLYFPRSAAESEASIGPAAAEHPGQGGQESILVVEDEEAVRRLMARILDTAGYAVLTARDGADALARLDAVRGRVDLLVSDVVMPNLDGSQLLLALRERCPGLPALFVSGYPRDIMSARAILDERTGFLPKPFTTGDLLARVRELLDR
jgi:PAS domain S-box-containing protein